VVLETGAGVERVRWHETEDKQGLIGAKRQAITTPWMAVHVPRYILTRREIRAVPVECGTHHFVEGWLGVHFIVTVPLQDH
jgi:hypothetical protein